MNVDQLSLSVRLYLLETLIFDTPEKRQVYKSMASNLWELLTQGYSHGDIQPLRERLELHVQALEKFWDLHDGQAPDGK